MIDYSAQEIALGYSFDIILQTTILNQLCCVVFLFSCFYGTNKDFDGKIEKPYMHIPNIYRVKGVSHDRHAYRKNLKFQSASFCNL